MGNHADRLPLLPALVVWPDQDAAAERAAFTARHGRAPEVVLVITVEDASVPDPGASGSVASVARRWPSSLPRLPRSLST